MISSFSDEKVYFYVGTDEPWANSTTPSSLSSANDVLSFKRSVWDNMAGAIKVTPNQVRMGIDRVNWSSGTIYENYNPANTSMGTGNGFFVLAGPTDRDVYKCLDNNGLSSSTIKPSNKDLGISKESDGYIWKYMYSISDSDFSKFSTDSHLPVPAITSQTSRRSDGEVAYVTISASQTDGVGGDYVGSAFSNGTVGTSLVTGVINGPVTDSPTDTSFLNLRDEYGLSDTDDYYNGGVVYITSGKSTGTLRGISDYTQSNKRITLDTSVTNIANGDTYIIGPKVTINDSNIGSGFVGIAEVNSYGNVTNIIVASSGLNYVNAAMQVAIGTVGATPKGTGATANAYVTPMNGHATNPQEELNAKYVIVAPETTIAKQSDYENGIFVGPSGDIRQVGLLLNPRAERDDTLYDQRTTFYFESTPTFSMDIKANKTVTNANTGGTAKIWSVDGDVGSQYLTVTNIQGDFSEGDTIYSGTTYLQISSRNISKHSYRSEVPFASIMHNGLTKYSGEIVYHENVFDIPRQDGQKENFKFIFSV